MDIPSPQMAEKVPSARAAPGWPAGPTPASQEAQELRESGLGVLQGDAQLAAQSVNPASEEAQELRQSGMRPLGRGGPTDKPLQVEMDGPERMMEPLIEQDPLKRRQGVAEAMAETDKQYADSTAEAMKNA